VPQGHDILTFVGSLDAEERKRAEEIVHNYERGLSAYTFPHQLPEGRENLKLQPGLHELFSWLHQESIPYSLLTRNSQEAIDHFLSVSNLTNFRYLLSRGTIQEFPYLTGQNLLL
jgi:hypothetical protein